MAASSRAAEPRRVAVRTGERRRVWCMKPPSVGRAWTPDWSACSEQVVDDELVQALVAAAAAGGGVRVERLLGAQLVEGLPRLEGGCRQVGHAGRGHGPGDLRVGPEPGRPLLEDQVGPHAAARELPDPV